MTVWQAPSSPPQRSAPAATPARLALRALVTVAVVLGWMGLVAACFAFTGAGGDETGRFWATGAYLPAAIVAGAIWWRRPQRWLIVATVALLAVTAGIVTADRAPATPSVLARVLDDVNLPDGARLLGQESRDTSFGSGTQLTRWLAVPTTPTEAAAAYQAALAREGFARVGAGLDTQGRWVRGRVVVVFRTGTKDVFLAGVPGAPTPGETVLYVIAASR